ncbi:MAG: methylated-DNA--[protein]-cysteine S-methyltransferase [Peptoniphilus sp.]|nr:methylated-DNA--[protein]-cysteine S-methyltransferase [Peptoniphilus sp.]MDY6045167.1 methylated-DNA--[protein]-cysteine S-methyltransferase [Peptoniphilus sp.]
MENRKRRIQTDKRDARVFSTPVGRLKIEVEGDAIAAIARTEDVPGGTEHPLAREAEAQLLEYFKGERTSFDLPLAIQTTPFYREVYEALLRVPYGEVTTYGDIARAVGRPKAYRAVGGAMRSNKHIIVIPCHRVVPASGGIGNYGGGVAMKAALLRLERGQ